MRDITPYRKNSKRGTAIRAERSRIDALEAQLRADRQAMVEACPHERKEGVYKGNTGNWCPDDDSYWIDATCLDCGKRWMIDSEEDKHEYRHFQGTIKVSTGF